MKTKHKILGVLTILAIVAALWVVVVSPASAVGVVTATPTPNTASAAAQYAISFPVGAAYTAGTDFFTITFPEGTQLPASFDRTTVTVLDNTTGAVGNPAQSPVIVSTNTVRIYIPPTNLSGGVYNGIFNGDTVTVTFTSIAGIKNPTVAATVASGKYTITVSSSQEAAVTSGAYAITRSVVVSPSHGGRGTTITVSGSGFVGTVTFLNMYPNPAAPTALSQINAASDGTFVQTLTATAPSFVAAKNLIVCMDGTGAASMTPAYAPGASNFNLDPSITVSPTSAPASGTVTVYVYDFPSADTFTAYNAGPPAVGSTTVAGILCGGGGGGAGVSSISITLPNSAAGLSIGATTLIVTSSSGAYAATSLAVVGRPVTVSPSSGAIGSTITIQGQSFHGGGIIKSITIGNVALFTDAAGTADDIIIDASGNIVASVLLNGVEAMQTGVGQTVMVTDDAANRGGNLFTITPRSITVDPTSSAIGSTVNVTGTGFRADGQTVVQYIRADGTQVGATSYATCDGIGGFITTITVPKNAGLGIPSTNSIKAWDPNAPTTVYASATHKVPGATVSVSPTSGGPGTQITITGSGFAQYATLQTLNLGNVDVRPTTTPYTGSGGTFSVTTVIPDMLAGTYALTAQVSGTSATTSFTVTTTPAGVTTVADGLAPIAGNFDQVWTLDAGTWKLYDPAAPASAEFTTLTPGMAIFVKCTSAVSNVTIGGAVRNLVAGWNLLGIVS